MSRREKRRQFSQWLKSLFFSAPTDTPRRRPILVEPLETRQLMAADGFMALLGSNYAQAFSQPDLGQASLAQRSTDNTEASSTLVAEGEPAADLVAFAKALTDSGTRFFGAAWCPHCTEQKGLFQDGAKFLPFIEVTNPDHSPNQVGIDEEIEEYPTWEFPDGTRLTGVQTLQTLSTRANVAIPQSSTPSIAPLGNVSVGIGSPRNIPIDAYDPNGNPLSITVTSSNPSLINAEVLTGNRSWELTVQNFGHMVFELFEQQAPRPAERVIELTQSGFYNGAPFHRVVNNFVIQAGDPVNQDGTGGSSLADFNDQFNVDLQHNQSGVLSYAKSTDDTNDSQFFITEGPQRFLDFNHSIFGQLVEGEAVRDAISNTPVNNTTQNRPVNPVIITAARIFTDNENGVVMLKPTGTGTGTATITVTVTDTEGNSTSQTFTATVVQDTANGAPFLNDIPTVQAQAGVPVTINLSSQDAENDTRIYSVTKLGAQNYTVTVDSSTGVVTLVPPTGFTGQLQFRATVRQGTTPTTDSPDDNQVVTVNVTQSSPTTIDLLAANDSGVSSTDNITNAQTLNFAVGGTESGATVEVLANGNVVGTATATGTTTNVTVSNVASLGQGSVLFTSRQRINGNNGSPSPALAVVLDSQAPAAIANGVIPATTIVNELLSIDLNHADEGNGLVYALVGAPAGMAINSSTGLLTWTPTTPQLGLRTVTLNLTDAAGNVFDQTVNISVVEQPLARISLNTVDMSGVPITTIAVGQQFKVQVIVKDLRTGTTIPDSPTGVYAAFTDLIFDSAIIAPIATNPIRLIDPYLNDAGGSTTTPGLIDELGAFSDRSTPRGPDAAVLAEITFEAKAAGNPNLRTDPFDQLTSEVSLYDRATRLSASQVEFLGSTFVVGANFTVANDVANFDEDSGPHVINVLSNDTTQTGAVLTISSVSTPSGGGTVTIASDGKTLNYTSAANFTGAETFTYTARNQQNVPLTATVTVQITDVNDPPVALNDTFTVFRNTTQNVLEVLSNDTRGVDATSTETLTVTAVSAGSAGSTIQLGPSGLTVRYTPATGFSGTETFTYTLSDSRGGTATGTVSVAVNLENPPPTPQNDTFTLNEDAAENEFDVLVNDTTSDPGETLSISGVGTSTNGSTVTVSLDGKKVRYRPATNFNGSEVLTYTLRDSRGATAVGQMTFTVAAVNDAPDAVNDTFTGLSSTTTQWNVLANDINVDAGQNLTITAVTQPPTGQGTVSISSDGKSLNYTGPGNNFAGNFSITYTVGDGTGLTDTATVAATISNYVPRTISGSLMYGETADARSSFLGVPITLTGTDISGATVSKSTTVGANGAYSFDQLAPGDYQLVREPLAFIEDAGATVNIQSGVSDGSAISNLNIGGSLKVGYFDIRDFLGSTVTNSLTVAVKANGTAAWIAPRGDWAQLSTLQAQLDTTANSLKINAANSTQNNLQATVPLTSSKIASVAGQESTMRLLRIRGSTTLAGLSPAATSASLATNDATSSQSAVGDSTNSQTSTSTGGLEGEGEGDVNSASATPALGDSSTLSPAASLLGDITGDTAKSDLNNPIQSSPASQSPVSQLTPSQAIRRLLGSNSNSSTRETLAMTAEAVDEAMQSVLPSLQLQLSDELSDTLSQNR